MNKDGTTANLAPYSQFMHATYDPPYIMFAANEKTAPDAQGDRKDNVVNIERTQEFCWSLGTLAFQSSRSAGYLALTIILCICTATYELRDEMNKSSTEVPYGTDEFELAGLEKQYGHLVKCPMVKRSPVKVRHLYDANLQRHADRPVGQFECRLHQILRLPGNSPGASVDVSSRFLPLCLRRAS